MKTKPILLIANILLTFIFLFLYLQEKNNVKKLNYAYKIEMEKHEMKNILYEELKEELKIEKEKHELINIASDFEK